MSTEKPGTLEMRNLKSSLSSLAEAAGAESPVAEPAGWTLPSGEDLLHFALSGGFLAPGILSATTSPRPPRRADQAIGTLEVESAEAGPFCSSLTEEPLVDRRPTRQAQNERSHGEVR